MISPSFHQPQAHLQAVRELEDRLEAVRAAIMDARQRVVTEIDHQLADLDRLRHQLEPVGSAPEPSQMGDLFEAAPGPAVIPISARAFSHPPKMSSVVLEPISPTAINPELEQATLEELNKALSTAFSEMANRRLW